MPVYTDAINHSITLESIPKRIISLVPSQTELLFDLGLRDEVVGITKFCIHPTEWFYSKQRVGGTKKLHHEIIVALQPDLIIANKEENLRDDILSLSEKFPVWTSDIKTLDDAFAMIENVGKIIGRSNEASKLMQGITQNFNSIHPLTPPIKVAYFIWRDPWMVAGGDTFINDMLMRCGFTNVFADLKRYPTVTFEQLRDASPERILLSSEPFPFTDKHISELSNEGLPPASLVDGEMFSWYGSRLLQAPAYFESLYPAIKR